MLLETGKQIGESTTCVYDEDICVMNERLNFKILHNIYEENSKGIKSISVFFDLPNGVYEHIKFITTYLGFGKIRVKIEYKNSQTNELSSGEKEIQLS